MLTWLLINIALSVLALVFITLNDTAPHRLRFFAGFAVLVAWLVPWPFLPNTLPDLLPANLFSFELWRIERAVEAGSTRLTGVFPVIVETRAVPLAREFIVLSVVELCFLALTLIGCALFTWKVVAHRLLLRQLERSSGDGNWLWKRACLAPVCPVGVQREIAGAFSSGLLRPRIWVHGDLVQSPQLATLLRHEVTHIQQHDNWYLLVITLVERLFWWNPLVWYLGRGTRELQELSCDERCQRANADYPVQLAQLMIDSARGACGPMTAQQPRMLALSANIFNNPNPNVKRIQLLQRSYPMLTRHILGAAVTAATAFLAVGIVTAQPDSVQAIAGQRVQVFTLERAPGAEDDVLFVQGAAGIGVGPQTVNMMGVRRLDQNDQFMKIDVINGERRIGFSFDNTPLPAVLMPLIGMMNHDMTTLPGPSERMELEVIRALDEDAETIYALPPEQVVEIVRAEGGTASWAQDGGVVSFTAARAVPASGAGPFHIAFAAAPLNDKLVLEYPEAANKIVSVTGTDLTLDEALDLIAEQSNCNIFQDGDTIVVDYCEE